MIDFGLSFPGPPLSLSLGFVSTISRSFVLILWNFCKKKIFDLLHLIWFWWWEFFVEMKQCNSLSPVHYKIDLWPLGERFESVDKQTNFWVTGDKMFTLLIDWSRSDLISCFDWFYWILMKLSIAFKWLRQKDFDRSIQFHHNLLLFFVSGFNKHRNHSRILDDGKVLFFVPIRNRMFRYYYWFTC